ncbi:exopolysaccharide biosynthesis protein [Caulobacter mirabilis]|uniref:Exopolysaccharide biosynthesis protein exod n=1 Tax=Caulobacter mirabilis TaxID=69666 RepID=A0A2D2B3E7_9CAUL|nr:exopolysaccharide biosynthesis protein [Caulobacter mirabilis]ATQ44783.1 exopolysaccharide biosynthesis protein exod [Caulobacter mirabilis]
MTPIEKRQTLSSILREICDDPDPVVTVGEVVHRFGPRAFGALLFFFSAPNWLPLPPGSSTFLAIPLLVITPQIAVGIRSPWLPKFVDSRAMPRATFAKAFERIIPVLERVEKVSRPRLGFMFGPIGDRVIGLTCFLLAVVLSLPIFLGNMPPAAAIAAFGLSLVQRDGLLAVLGFLITGISAGLLIIGGHAALLIFRKASEALGMA